MAPHTDRLNETRSLSHIDPVYTVIKKRVKYMANFFEQTCLHYPNNIAVICGSSQLTYLQLDRRANRLARLLLQNGLKEGQTVGIYMERSVNTYIAILAVLKAGGAFVPLDPSFPADRVTYIAEDATLQFLITTSTMRDKTQELPCYVLELDKATDALAAHPSTDPYIRVSPASLCYIIYTSGTTGRPKGVGISHANIANFLRVIPSIYGVKSTDRVYQGMSTAFDFSIEEIWPTWIAGATLVAGPTDSRRLGHGLTEFLIEHQITVLYCVPTLLSTIDQDIPTVHTLLVGGEACPPDLVRRWYRSGRRILNTYGPTETTVTATWCELYPDRPVTIGVPLPTYRVYILNEQFQPVLQGESGEICIGGPGVGLGYINRPDLTKSKFIDNPIRKERATVPRLYRSGDLGRITPDGEIEYLGRIDTQVKIRGYRIELSEIESVIREDEAVENAVVTPLMQDEVVQDLVAYVTLSNPSAKNALSDLRERIHNLLRQRLPVYMVPSYIEVLDSFPLLAADKVNRKALPAPTSPRLGTKTGTYVASTTALQSKIATIWAQALGQERVSVEADFFTELGGHSLAAARVVSQMRQEPGMQGLSIGDLYMNPTISRLAQFIEAELAVPTPEQSRASAGPPPRLHSNLRVLGCGLAQLVMLYGWMFFLSISAIALLYAVLLLLHLPVNSLLTGTIPVSMLSGPVLLAIAVVSVIWFFASIFLLPVVVGRLLMSGIRPGWYPLWGITYLRWWFYGKLLALSPVGLLSGSPLLLPYLRLLGAKVGRNCHIGSASKIGMPMFVEIGDDVSIGYEGHLEPFLVENGWLRVAPIRIGTGSFVGTGTVVLAGAQIGSYTSVGVQSLVPTDYTIPSNEHWAGSPIKRLPTVPPLLQTMAAQADNRRWPLSVLIGFVLGTLLLTELPLLMSIPSLVLIALVTIRAGLVWGMASTLLAGPLQVLVICFLIIVCKLAVMPKARAGIYPERSGFGVRKWLSDHLMALSAGLTRTLYDTLYLKPFLRLLGAHIGRWSEISTVSFVDPDMLIIGDESFVAGETIVAPAVFCRGLISLAPAQVGRRSFVGNGAILPGGCSMGDNSLLGLHSVPPGPTMDPGTTWLGSPSIFLPRRQSLEGFPDEMVFKPALRSVLWRLGIEYFTVTLPATILDLALLIDIYILIKLALMLPPLVLLALMPILALGLGAGCTLIVLLFKWLIVGKYRPRKEPLWSVWVRLTELITGLFTSVAAPMLLAFFMGTPWIAPLLRLFGTKIGRRVWITSISTSEFDLVEIGDDVAIGEETGLQTHLYEDRVMKMSLVKVGAAASIGSRSVVLYDAEIGPGACLDSQSLVMKGESLPAGSRWQGIPARPN